VGLRIIKAAGIRSEANGAGDDLAGVGGNGCPQRGSGDDMNVQAREARENEMRMLGVSAAMLAVVIGLTGGAGRAVANGEVNIYSYRQQVLIEPLLVDFTKRTGIKTNVIFANKGLIERMKAEGANSPADVLLATDIGNLVGAIEADVAQPVGSQVLQAVIPAQYRDSEGRWFGLTRRARVVYASRVRVAQDAITYEELADPKWKGRVCVRSGQHVYNIALFASLIAHHGEDKARRIIDGLRANLVHKPSGNDRSQVKSVFSGECDIAIGNTYYMGLMQTNEKKPEEQAWAQSVKILFPNSKARGTHVNLSGMVMAKHAPHKENALKFMEYLASAEAQKIYADINHEYPVRDGVAWSERVRAWGEFKPDPLGLEEVAKLRRRASEIVDEVRFNVGPN
jgi:iron(III) transport system substrate-binding protein